MLAARVEQKNGTYLNNIQRDRQSSPSPTPVAVFGICPDRHSQLRETFRDFHERVAKQIMNLLVASPQRWAGEVAKAGRALIPITRK
jgi:hypothetical protein